VRRLSTCAVMKCLGNSISSHLVTPRNSPVCAPLSPSCGARAASSLSPNCRTLQKENVKISAGPKLAFFSLYIQTNSHVDQSFSYFVNNYFETICTDHF
jgi:hypothetical protein